MQADPHHPPLLVYLGQPIFWPKNF